MTGWGWPADAGPAPSGIFPVVLDFVQDRSDGRTHGRADRAGDNETAQSACGGALLHIDAAGGGQSHNDRQRGQTSPRAPASAGASFAGPGRAARASSSSGAGSHASVRVCTVRSDQDSHVSLLQTR